MGAAAHGVFAVNRKAKILSAVLVSVTLVVAAAWLAPRQPEGGGDSGRRATAAVGQPTGTVGETKPAKDSDGDGLKDWEEAIWRTDPARADSDGDGTADGREIADNRDPRRPGPNDQYGVTEETTAENAAAAAPAPENLTAQLGARIASDVIGGIGRNRQPDVASLAEDYASGLERAAVLGDARRFAVPDITLAPENDLLSVLKFFAALEQAWGQHFKPGQATDLEVFLKAFQGGSEETAAKALVPYRAGYREAIATVRSTPTPEDLQPFAVEFLNFLSRADRSVELMQGFKTDPLAAMLAIRERLALNEEFDAFIARSIPQYQNLVKRKVAELAAQQKR